MISAAEKHGLKSKENPRFLALSTEWNKNVLSDEWGDTGCDHPGNLAKKRGCPMSMPSVPNK
jgi:hypothetical protein